MIPEYMCIVSIPTVYSIKYLLGHLGSHEPSHYINPANINHPS